MRGNAPTDTPPCCRGPAPCPSPPNNRDVWRNYTQPGTLRGLSRAVWSWARGGGFHFEFPQQQQADAASDTGTGYATSEARTAIRSADNWWERGFGGR